MGAGARFRLEQQTWPSPIRDAHFFTVLLSTLDDSAPARTWQGAIKKRLKRGLSSPVGVSLPKKSVRCMMTQIDPAQFLDKLIDIEVAAQMSMPDGLLDELLQ